MIAHVAGAPVEETFLPLLSGLGATLVFAIAWVTSRLHRLRRPREPKRE